MRKIMPLSIDHSKLYREAIGQTQRNVDRASLEALEDDMIQAGVKYDAAMRAGKPHTIKAMDLSPDVRELVSGLYDKRLVDKNGVCRETYKKIRNSASHCPYCEWGEIYEVDHFLPQASYPDLNIYPKNLVPICHPCNNLKLASVPESTTGYFFLHPYFDELPQVRWLFARMEFQSDGPVLIYRISMDENVYGSQAGRLAYHFKTLHLSDRLRVRSSKVLTELQQIAEQMLPVIGVDGLANHFKDEGNKIFNMHRNTLEAAAYTAAGDCAEFCNGRFRN